MDDTRKVMLRERLLKYINGTVNEESSLRNCEAVIGAKAGELRVILEGCSDLVLTKQRGVNLVRTPERLKKARTTAKNWGYKEPTVASRLFTRTAVPGRGSDV